MYNGKVQLTRIWSIKPEAVEMMEKNVEDHTEWMQKTHFREGEKALLMLNWCKQSEVVNGEETGNTLFVLTEIYESFAGIDDHMEQASRDNFLTYPEAFEHVAHQIFCDRLNVISSLW